MSETRDGWTPPIHWPPWPGGRDLIYLVLLYAILIGGNACSSLVELSLGNDICYPAMAIIDSYQFFLGWPLFVFFVEFLRRWSKASLARSIILSSLSAFVALSANFFFPFWFPTHFFNPGELYLHSWRPYVESHWQVDPVTHLVYFPFDYSQVGNRSDKLLAPRYFFVLDDKKAFVLDNQKYSDTNVRKLTSPSCPGAKYEALRLEGQIYIVHAYVDESDDIIQPCLVTPARIEDSRLEDFLLGHPDWFRGNLLPSSLAKSVNGDWKQHRP